MRFQRSHLFRLGTIATLSGFVYWLEPNHSALEIERHSEVTKEVSSQYSVLREASSFIYRIQIEHCGTDLLFCERPEHDLRQEHRLDIFSDSCRAIHSHSSGKQIVGHALHRRELFRYH